MLDRDRLLSPRLPVADVEIADVGTVKVRALTRAELLRVPQTGGQPDPLEIEAYMIATALVDPVLTPDEVRAWQESAPGSEMNAVMAAINRLSGTEGSSQRDKYKSVPGPS